MASTQPKGSSTSQFFVNLVNNPSLDDNYTVFAKVISGMSAVCALANPHIDPTFGSTEPSLPSSSPYYSQPAYPSRAMLNNVTIIPVSLATGAPQTPSAPPWLKTDGIPSPGCLSAAMVRASPRGISGLCP
jgi:hypothetical protein